MDVNVIIPTYNRKDSLRQTLGMMTLDLRRLHMGVVLGPTDGHVINRTLTRIDS